MKKRIKWIDVAKFIGICAVYLGHFCDDAGLTYMFVFKFHVPLFFFLSGCMNNYDNDSDFIHFIKKKFKRIMVPFYGFALFSILIATIANNYTPGQVRDMLWLVVKGCERNTFFAPALWFLSCLFVMEVVFKLIKMLKSRWLMIAAAVVLFLISTIAIKPDPTGINHWVYNIDSVLYYIVFYAVGYCIYPFILKLFELNTRREKAVCIVIFVISAVYSAFLFEGISIGYNIVANEISKIVVEVLQPLIVIIFILMLSKMLEGISFMSETGRETLYLCGNEWIVKAIVPSLLSLVGLQIEVHNPLETWMYTFILLFLAMRALIPIEKRFVSSVKSVFC